MIHLTRRPLAEALASKLRAWNTQLSQYLAAGTDIPESLASKYRQPELKAHIRAETYDKCAYCESKLSQVYPGDVEHILPKKHFQEFMLSAENLTLACFECNNRKSDFYDLSDPLIDPYDDDPADHFVAAGPLVKHKPGDDRAFLTEFKLELNRAALFERRMERLESLHRLAHMYVQTKNPAIKQVLAEQLAREASAEMEYSFVVRSYLTKQCGMSL